MLGHKTPDYTACYNKFVWEIQSGNGVVKYIGNIDLDELVKALKHLSKKRVYEIRAMYIDSSDVKAVVTPILAYTKIVRGELEWRILAPQQYNNLQNIRTMYNNVIRAVKQLQVLGVPELIDFESLTAENINEL